MAFIKVKIAPKIIPKKKEKENVYDKVSRENLGIREKEKYDNLEKEKAGKKEKDRIRIIIDKYLDSLDTQLDEKELYSFWTFPDRTGFKKYKNKSLKDIQRIVNKDIDQYKNRNIAKIHVKPFHHEKSDSMHGKVGVLLSVGISIFPIDNNGVLNGKDNAWGCDFTWHDYDFKISKFSFKLLERILESVQKHDLTGSYFIGTPFTNIVYHLKKLKVNLEDVLSPLAGV